MGGLKNGNENYVIDEKEKKYLEEYFKRFPKQNERKYKFENLQEYMDNAKKEKGNTLLLKEDIDRVKENIERHSWARNFFDRIKKQADYWDGFTDEQLYSLIPPDNPRTYTPGQYEGCPVHGGLNHQYRTSIETPYRWQCVTGGEWWYDGAEVINPGTGEKVTVTDDGWGWKAPEGFPGSGKRYYYVAAYRAYLLKRLFSEPYIIHMKDESFHGHPAVIVLAYAYAVTGEVRYARKAFILLNRLAEVYRDYNGNWYPHRCNTASHIDDHVWESLYCKYTALAYDMIFDALVEMGGLVDFFDRKSYKGKKYGSCKDLQENIEKNLFGTMLEFAQNTRLGPGPQCFLLTRGAILFIGCALGNAKLVEYCIEGVNGINEILDNAMYLEGKYVEDTYGYLMILNDFIMECMCCKNAMQKMGLSYNEYNIRKYLFFRHEIDCGGRLPVFGDMGYEKGRIDFGKTGWEYTDEAVYILKGDLRKMLAHKKAGQLEKRNESILDEKHIPSPHYICDFFLAGKDYPVLLPGCEYECASSVVFPDSGLAILRSKGGRKHVPVSFANSHGHTHRDKLGLNIFAFGYSLINDLGYPASLVADKRQGWDSNSASHPVVVVDERNQELSYGNLHNFINMDSLSMVEVSQEAAYGIPLYRRMLFSAGGSNGEWYVLDIFRVKGGSRHDYLLPGALPDSGSLKITGIGEEDWERRETGTLAGEDVKFAARQGYGYLKDVRMVKVQDKTVEAFWETADAEKTGLRVIYPADSPSEFIRCLGEEEGPVFQSKLKPYLIKRKDKAEGETSVFISVLEPYQGEYRIKGVSILRSSDDNKDDTSFGVEVIMDGCKHYFFGSSGHKGSNTFLVDGSEVTVDAEAAFFEEVKGKIMKAFISSGEGLHYKGMHLLNRPDLKGKVTMVNNSDGYFCIRLEAGYMDEEDIGSMIYTESGTIRRQALTIKRFEKIDEGLYMIYNRYDSVACGRFTVFERVDDFSIYTMSEIGKDFALGQYYTGRDVELSNSSYSNRIKSIEKVDPNMRKVTFHDRIGIEVGKGDKFFISSINKGVDFTIKRVNRIDKSHINRIISF